MAVFVFLVILVLFFGIIASMSAPERGERLSKDAELITKALTGKSESSIVEKNKVEQGKIQEFINEGKYDDLRRELGIRGNFCIYFEDNEGNLVPVLVDDMGTPDPSDDQYIHGIGSEEIIINDVKCGVETTR